MVVDATKEQGCGVSPWKREGGKELVFNLGAKFITLRTSWVSLISFCPPLPPSHPFTQPYSLLLLPLSHPLPPLTSSHPILLLHSPPFPPPLPSPFFHTHPYCLNARGKEHKKKKYDFLPEYFVLLKFGTSYVFFDLIFFLLFLRSHLAAKK